MGSQVTTNLKIIYTDGTFDIVYDVVRCRNYGDGKHLTLADGSELILHNVAWVRYFMERSEAEELDD